MLTPAGRLTLAEAAQKPCGETSCTLIKRIRALGQIVRNHGPMAAGSVDVEDGVEDQPHVDGAQSVAVLGRWNQRFDQRPLFIRDIRRVSLVQRSPILELVNSRED